MKLTKSERMELQRQAGARSARADVARHARLILLLADGLTWAEVRAKLDCSDSYIDRWSKRFAADRLAGLFARHAGRERYKVTERIEAKVLAWTTKRKPADGSTHWSSRKLAAELGEVSHMSIARIWAKHALKPHRIEGYMASNDPNFEAKAADVIGLYLNPPAHAAVFSVDEKTAIQALDRKDRVLALSPGRAERHGFEYYRHGTLSLYAAFNTKTGEVLGKTATRHTSSEFVAFLTDIVAHQPKRKEIHVIADNLSAHKTNKVHAFSAEHPNDVAQKARLVADALEPLARDLRVEVRGPAKAPIERVRGKWRWMILLLSPSSRAIGRVCREARTTKIGSRVDMTIDVDPMAVL